MKQSSKSSFWPLIALIILGILTYGVWLRYGTERGIEIQIENRVEQIHQAYDETKYDFNDIPRQAQVDRQIPLSRMESREKKLKDIVTDLNNLNIGSDKSESLNKKRKQAIKEANLVYALSYELRQFSLKGNPKNEVNAQKNEKDYLALSKQTQKNTTKSYRKFSSCDEAHANGFGPFVQGVDPQYLDFKDLDADGQVCELKN